ncbi:MAG TPA: toll/interleukin-1 receptor domain-containing protein [Pseudonocardiaceae bacterium]|nr:toll/interleukin-1 receptor domain-containing protein [Pseudonocardiaceae bacterium]
MRPGDEIEIGIEIDPAAAGLIVRSLDSTTERVQVGIVRLRRWQVHPIQAAPAVFDGQSAYLVKVNYQLELDLAPLRWFEFGLSLVETQLGQATILDALPRTSSMPMPGAAHVLSKHLDLVPTSDTAAVDAFQPPTVTAVTVHGIGSSQIRWRHTALDPAGVQPDAYVAWLVLLVDDDRSEQPIELAVRYDVDEQPDLTPFQRPARFPLTLRPARGLGHSGGFGEPAASVAPSTGTPAAERVDAAPRVFICYAHDDPAHKLAVRDLARLLLDNDIDVHLDTWDEGRRRDWQHWAITQITEADFVLIVGSPVCRAVGDGRHDATDHAGIRSELDIIRNLLQRYPKWQDYLLPVVLPGEPVGELPLFLRPQTADYFPVSDFTAAGAEGLIAAIQHTPRRTWPLR